MLPENNLGEASPVTIMNWYKCLWISWILRGSLRGVLERIKHTSLDHSRLLLLSHSLPLLWPTISSQISSFILLYNNDFSILLSTKYISITVTVQFTVRNQLLPLHSKGRQESSQSHLLIRIMHQTESIKYCLYDVEKRHGTQDMTLSSDIPQWDTFSFFLLAKRVWLNLLSPLWDERSVFDYLGEDPFQEHPDLRHLWPRWHNPHLQMTEVDSTRRWPFQPNPFTWIRHGNCWPHPGNTRIPSLQPGSLWFEILSSIKIAMG